jgi:two-component system, NtrC family, response regulator HydG
VVCEGDAIVPEHLPASLRTTASTTVHTQPNGGKPGTLQELERTHIRLALLATYGHRGNAAKMLGISERNLYRKLREHGLLPDS